MWPSVLRLSVTSTVYFHLDRAGCWLVLASGLQRAGEECSSSFASVKLVYLASHNSAVPHGAVLPCLVMQHAMMPCLLRHAAGGLSPCFAVPC